MLTAWRRLSPSHRFLLAVLGATSFFEGYDRGILELALPQIRHSYGLSQSAASFWLAALYLGALPALFLGRRADRIGRRRLLLISLSGYTVATGLTALAPTIGVFVVCQFVARLFLNAENAVVWALAAEELPAESRGFGFGMLAMNAALGVGFGAILFGGVLDPLGISWRWLYALGVPPLLLVAVLRRSLPESRRFEVAKAAGHLASTWRAIFRPPHRHWIVLLTLTAFLGELVTHASLFVLDFLQTDRGISASTASFMLVAAGLPGIPMMVAAGSLSDRVGRRLVGCLAGVLAGVGSLGFFWLPGGVPVLLPCMCLMLVGSMGSFPVLNGYATELFPTAFRGQAASWATVARVVGQVTSLGLGAVLLAVTGSLPPTATILGIGSVLAIGIYAVFFPDTHGRELEDITGEDELAAPPITMTPV